MSETIRIKLHSAQQAHVAISAAFQSIKPHLIAERAFDLTIKPETRSTAQNRRLWAMLADVAAHVVWHGQKLQAEEWKEMATAALKRQRVVPGIDGGFVVLGASTRAMTKAELGELMDFLEAFGAEHGVRFRAPEYDEASA